MKKILLFVLSTFIIIGGAGCMKKDSNEYKQEILTYLEQKYEEIFVVDSMMRQKTMGKVAHEYSIFGKEFGWN